jgi:hypothetical protein
MLSREQIKKQVAIKATQKLIKKASDSLDSGNVKECMKLIQATIKDWPSSASEDLQAMRAECARVGAMAVTNFVSSLGSNPSQKEQSVLRKILRALNGFASEMPEVVAAKQAVMAFTQSTPAQKRARGKPAMPSISEYAVFEEDVVVSGVDVPVVKSGRLPTSAFDQALAARQAKDQPVRASVGLDDTQARIATPIAAPVEHVGAASGSGSAHADAGTAAGGLDSPVARIEAIDSTEVKSGLAGKEIFKPGFNPDTFLKSNADWHALREMLLKKTFTTEEIKTFGITANKVFKSFLAGLEGDTKQGNGEKIPSQDRISNGAEAVFASFVDNHSLEVITEMAPNLQTIENSFFQSVQLQKRDGTTYLAERPTRIIPPEQELAVSFIRTGLYAKAEYQAENYKKSREEGFYPIKPISVPAPQNSKLQEVCKMAAAIAVGAAVALVAVATGGLAIAAAVAIGVAAAAVTYAVTSLISWFKKASKPDAVSDASSSSDTHSVRAVSVRSNNTQLADRKTNVFMESPERATKIAQTSFQPVMAGNSDRQDAAAEYKRGY